MVYIRASRGHTTILCRPVMTHYTIASIMNQMKLVQLLARVYIRVSQGHTTILSLSIMSHYTIASIRYQMKLVYT